MSLSVPSVIDTPSSGMEKRIASAAIRPSMRGAARLPLPVSWALEAARRPGCRAE